MRYSIIMAAHKNLGYTSRAIESVFKHTQDFELILIDNGSKPNSPEYGWYDGLQKQAQNVKVIHNEKNLGFSKACNQGLKIASGDVLILLNNDVLVTPYWADNMLSAMNKANRELPLKGFGLVGPASNYVGGRQHVGGAHYEISQLDDFAVDFRQSNKDNFMYAGFLSGFCLMFTREVFEDVGLLDERFSPGGFEDNDFCLRAAAKGWKALIDGSTFIHHFGSKTLDLDEFKHMRRGLANRIKFIDKWHDSKPQKLVAVYRVKDCAEKLMESLEKTSEFADEIVVLCDNCTDNTVEVARSFQKVVKVHESNLPFNERRDRNRLIEMAKERDPDWIISIDGDEVFEDKVDREYMQRLMHPPNPEIKCYGFSWYTFFLGRTHWRSDGIFGGIRGFRMFKNEPNQKIVHGNKEGLHGGNIPQFPVEYCRWTNVRIKHYGYDTLEECQRKYQWYEQLDDDKNPRLIGANDYRHLLAESVQLTTWIENNGFSLCMMVKDEEEQLPNLFETWWSFMDEIVVVVDDSTKDQTEEVAKRYTNKVYRKKLNDSFSEMRNFSYEKATKEWILQLDPDESMPDFINLRRMAEDPRIDGYIFIVKNHQKDGVYTGSEAIRFFRNKPGFRLTGLVHEGFDESIKRHKLKIVQAPLAINHFGYLKGDERVEEKLQLYERLNKKQMRQNPRDARPPFNLALHRLNEGKTEQGVMLLKKAKNLKSDFVLPRKELGFVYLRMAYDELQGAAELLKNGHYLKTGLNEVVQKVQDAIGRNQTVKVGKARKNMKEQKQQER